MLGKVHSRLSSSSNLSLMIPIYGLQRRLNDPGFSRLPCVVTSSAKSSLKLNLNYFYLKSFAGALRRPVLAVETVLSRLG